MNTNISTSSGNAVGALKNLKAGLANVRDNTKPKGGEPILRLGRDGIWIFGADNLEVEDGSTWAVNPLSLQHGYICWKVIPKDSKDTPELLGNEMASMFSPKPDKLSLPDYGASKWVDCLSFNLLCLSGEDKGEQVLYKTSSIGGIKATNAFLADIMAQLDKDAGKPVPVIKLKSDSYKHTTYGKTYFPVFDIVEFVPMDEAPTAEPAAKQEAPKEPEKVETQPVGTRRRGAAPAPAPEPEVEEQVEDEPVTASPQAAPAGEVRRRRRG